MAIMKRTTQTKTAQTKATQTKTTQTTSGELGQSLTFAATHSVKSVCRKFHTTRTPCYDIAQANTTSTAQTLSPAPPKSPSSSAYSKALQAPSPSF